MINILWDNLFKKNNDQNNILTVLKKCYLFDDLTSKEIRFVSELVHPRQYQPGEYIFKEGEKGIGMYIIVRGSVNIHVKDDTTSAQSTKTTFVTKLNEGDFFGEISFSDDNGRRMASATSHDELLVIGFFKPDLEEIIQRNPATGIKIVTKLVKILGRRLRDTALKVAELKQELKQLV